MSDTIEPLIFDLVAWVAKEDRAYAEVMDAWRTSCPRLPVWEEANARGLLTRTRGSDGTAVVRVTDAGRAFIDGWRRTGCPPGAPSTQRKSPRNLVASSSARRS